MVNLHSHYLALMADLFRRDFVPANPSLRRALSITPLLRNGAVLLTGNRGTGKSSFVSAVARRFFVQADGTPSLARVNCHQELMDTNVLYRVRFSEPDRAPEPRALLRTRLRFVDEIARMSPNLQNALLSFLAEGEVIYEDHRFPVPDGVTFLARNPMDQGQDGVVAALHDRFDVEILVPDNPCPSMVPDGDGSSRPLDEQEMQMLWESVEAVPFGDVAWWYLHLVNYAFSACVVERGTANPLYELPCSGCEFQREICRQLRSTPGRRGLLSTIKVARALAWMDGASEVTIRHVEEAVPWTYGHRLDFHNEVLISHPDPQHYLREVFVQGSLDARRDKWLQAIEHYLAGELPKLLELAGMSGDLVVAWIASRLEEESRDVRDMQMLMDEHM